MTQVNIQSLKAMNDFGEIAVKVSQNLVNSAEYVEGFVKSQAEASGSPAMEAIASDVADVLEATKDRLDAYKKQSSAMEEYTYKISKVNQN